ncbi:MAG: alpha/beta hydrolase [Bdellovibrionales bacterium]
MNVSKLHPAPEDRVVELSTGLKVHGWYFRSPKQPARAVIVFFHGNAQNRSSHFLALYWIVEKGYDLAVFDYPGYGQTAGTPTPASTVHAAAQVLRALHRETSPLPLVVYGQSLGGAIAMRAVWELREEFRPNLMVIDSSFLWYTRTARAVLGKSAWTWLLQPLAWITLSDKWAPGARLEDLEGLPIVVIHSREDEVIPYRLGKEVFDSARGPKEMWTKERGKHNETFGGDEGKRLKERLIERLSAIKN